MKETPPKANEKPEEKLQQLMDEFGSVLAHQIKEISMQHANIVIKKLDQIHSDILEISRRL